MLPLTMRLIAILLLTFRMLQSGSYATQSPNAPRLIVARDAVTMRNVWNIYVGRGDAPPVDFAKESAAFLFAGQRNTGGYGISVKKVTIGRKEVIIDAALTTPPADAMVTQALTSPFAVIAIAKKNPPLVRWVDDKKVIDQEKPRK
jgi:hypothetical protein